MNPQIPSDLDPLDDARLEALLRADAAGEAYIEDAGFTARLMAQLPPPRRQRSYSWLGPALGGVAVAGVACYSPVLGDLAASVKTALHGHVVPVQGLMVLVPMVVLAYGAAWFAATDSR
jgi:hypothetical protein